MIEDDEDAALMVACRDGDEEAFVRLYHRHRDRVINYARRLLGNQAAGEEAAQDVFLKLFKARKRYKPKSRFTTYLYKITTNHCLNLRSRLAQRTTYADADIDTRAKSTASQEADAAHAQLQQALLHALKQLPGNQRAALVLVHYEGLTYQEAGAAIGASESSVKSLIHRARKRLSSVLQPWEQHAHSEVDHAL